MTDTAQPETAAETEVVDPIEAAANAFKTFDDKAPDREDRPRDANGRFVSNLPKEEIEAEEETEAPAAEDEPEAESQDDAEETEEASEEDQPEAVELPPSWPSEMAEQWSSLPPETQAFIREREGQRESAVNAKFQEAANLRKAHEAEISEAQTNRQAFAEAADFVLSMVTPQEPPLSMLDQRSSDYNPDEYHLKLAEHKQQTALLRSLYQQRQAVAQQEYEEQERTRAAAQAQIEEKYGPLLIKAVPDLAVPEKQPQIISELVRYAIDNGVPQQNFTDPERAKGITSADFLFAWKAREYDKMMAAKAQVKPQAAKPTAPVVRPGVTTPRSAIEATKRKAAQDRLARSGSIEDAAAIFKTVFKG
jgi:hypothetical protein